MPKKPRDLRERLMEKVVVSDDGCWEWTGQTNGRGYGVIWTMRHQNKEYVHRLSYEFVHGPIPAGLEIDHLCRNRGCVNPAHLEAVTRRVNQLRGYSVSGRNARKTHCPKGHEFTPENTYFPPTGGRQCVQCRREYREEHRARLREEQRRRYAENPEKYQNYKRAWRKKRREQGLPPV